MSLLDAIAQRGASQSRLPAPDWWGIGGDMRIAAGSPGTAGTKPLITAKRLCGGHIIQPRDQTDVRVNVSIISGDNMDAQQVPSKTVKDQFSNKGPAIQVNVS
ncbi:hypothetical protein FH972_021043 [Carpinus fangiana]|uniref:Uncharacterized protein n=1 Tax=Carpinus fangiana TaxID=176857 RepID=A0A5N6KNE0_9ROSI|nr:hypothetical protein FH972_021043 [Carpinus fangiana]